MPDAQKPAPMTPEAAAKTAEALAKARAEAEARNADETVPGGRYMTPDGTLVDAEGKPVKG